VCLLPEVLRFCLLRSVAEEGERLSTLVGRERPDSRLFWDIRGALRRKGARIPDAR